MPLNALPEEEDDDMIAFFIVLAVLFLLSLVALAFRTWAYDGAVLAVAEMPAHRASGGGAARKRVVVLDRDDSPEPESDSSSSSYDSETVTEYNAAGGVVRSVTTHRRPDGTVARRTSAAPVAEPRAPLPPPLPG